MRVYYDLDDKDPIKQVMIILLFVIKIFLVFTLKFILWITSNFISLRNFVTCRVVAQYLIYAIQDIFQEHQK